jgi:predicted ATPase
VLSLARQLALLRLIHIHVETRHSQFVIATHSPILMGYPGAPLYHFSDAGIKRVAYEETEHYQITRGFLSSRAAVLKELFMFRPLRAVGCRPQRLGVHGRA